MTNVLNVFGIILFVNCLAFGQAAIPWSCQINATGQPINVEQLSGAWYEVARLPPTEVPACLEVTAPNSIEKDLYTLKLDYVDNVSNGWKPVQEKIEFPWDAETQNGKFNLTYSGSDTNVTVDFVYMGTLNNLTVVCGYSGIAPSVSLIRILSRNRTVDSKIRSEVENIVTEFGIAASEMTWVEQGPKCNSGSFLSSSILVVLLTAKLLVFGFAIVAVACAQYAPSSEYLPPALQEASQSIEVAAPTNEYLAPAAVAEEQTVFADDGYRYKTVRRLRHRQRRDVSELTQYLPPTQEATIEVAAPSNEYLAPAVVAEEQTVLADDGYRYKTVRRLRHRQRRDVSELTQYLPPAQEATIEVAAPSNEYLAPAVVAEQQTVLADDGYRYKTVRRLRHRQRRDVSELTQYLPPAQEATIEVAAPSNEYLAPAVVAEEQTVLADDGYRYKTVRRLRHRQRRDVSELTQYLPPAQEATIEVAAPSNEYLAPAVVAEEQTVLADDGYRYKTVRRLRHRQRRDVSELTQYLPPAQEATFEVAAPSNEYLAPAVVAGQQTVLADDGYRYKKLTFVFVAVIFGTACAALVPINEYLPPLEDASPTSNVDLQSISESSPLTDDGYRYKIVKRLRLRQRRDVNELPSNEYLPPAQETQVVEEVTAPVEESAVLADDGYRYKTVKRIRYRHRRDVSELPSNEYLPPAQETQVVEEVAAPVEESAVLVDDGYRYKTVKRIRYRHRRDINELPSNEYLPPAQESQVVEEVAAPVEESAVLADDGYRYKTVKRIRYRHRRDVNELPSNEYLPPQPAPFVADIPIVTSADVETENSQDSAVLADDGYRYKAVKRIRYRQRRDVNELPSNEYLPPVQETQAIEEVVSPVENSAVLASDGYRYKTAKRVVYKRRV
ncbi:uncharacterized protein LOC133338157 [Musca vetustissima]|uniref:uncharacterized protein LOC133338157 n=1 Tax=Musca vetustissima TaxID=27455 RepID=UPI002AB5E820|nr:uncharacterized protein LOC133338157 [Musca vetustissima]